MGHFSLCHVVAHNWADKMLSPVCESNPPVAWAGTGKEQPVREQVDGGLRYKKTTWV
ncbi:unnamed protein product [Ilex paraguariensis]|uniref:Uncharacterized protein n=1 Tax=Ilex paraguariensis TaxID=185542 RepID=A0ABC8UPF4_9AQUA